MLRSFLFFLSVYLLVVFMALLGFFWQDVRFFYLSAINFLFLFLFFLVSYFVKKKEQSLGSKEDLSKKERVHNPNQFVKYPYIKQKKPKSWSGLLLFVVLILFLLSVVDLVFWNYLGEFIRLFPGLYLLLLFAFAKDLIENKLKIFGMPFDFNFFWFLSSFVVLILVAGTLVFEQKSVLFLLGLLSSFLFFFFGYLFIKNQGFRFFFKMIYSRIYFILIFSGFVWSLFAISNQQNFKSIITNIEKKIETIFEKKNDDPLLFDEKGELVSSGVLVNNQLDEEDFIYEESGEVLIPSLNPIFVSEDKDIEDIEDLRENENLSKDSLMEDLSLKNSDSISMIDSLRFLMRYYDIELSKNTNTKFTYVSLQNPNYSYWKTAYDRKMIGASNNPSTKISCETYQVFKGMLLGWDLKYDSSNVKKVFWDESQKRNMLNACEYGKLLKGENL